MFRNTLKTAVWGNSLLSNPRRTTPGRWPGQSIRHYRTFFESSVYTTELLRRLKRQCTSFDEALVRSTVKFTSMPGFVDPYSSGLNFVCSRFNRQVNLDEFVSGATLAIVAYDELLRSEAIVRYVQEHVSPDELNIDFENIQDSDRFMKIYNVVHKHVPHCPELEELQRMMTPEGFVVRIFGTFHSYLKQISDEKTSMARIETEVVHVTPKNLRLVWKYGLQQEQQFTYPQTFYPITTPSIWKSTPCLESEFDQVMASEGLDITVAADLLRHHHVGKVVSRQTSEQFGFRFVETPESGVQWLIHL